MSATLQKQMQKIQADFQAKVKDAIKSGRQELIPGLVAKMQTELMNVTKVLDSHPRQATYRTGQANTIYQHGMSSLALHKLALPSDTDYMHNLESQTSLSKVLSDEDTVKGLNRWHRAMLSKAMRLTPQVSRPFFKIVDHCRKVLDFKPGLEFFVIQDRVFNAGIFPSPEGFSIYFTSGLLENFTPEELGFVIGREMGHALFLHTKIPTDFLVREFNHVLSPRDMIAMHSWQRASDVSADRAGLLCTQDFNAASQAFFKMASGITSKAFQFSVRDFMEDYDDLERYIRQSPADKLDDFFSNHPLNPIRLRALELFSKSTYFYNLTNRPPVGALEDSEMEEQIHAFMNLMEPTYLHEKTDIAHTVREFIFLVGYMLAKSDGDIDPRELAQLSKLLDGEDTKARVKEVKSLTEKRLIDKICGHAEKMSFELPAVQRLNILRDAFSIVSADDQILDPELAVMAKVCGVLKVRPSFIDEILRRSPMAA